MRKKLIISESEIDEIRRMYGLVTEQSSSFSIPKEVAGFISKIESVFSIPFISVKKYENILIVVIYCIIKP
jgi:hypothetical protein